LIPAQPPRGVSTIQGNFLSTSVRDLVKTFVAESAARKQLQHQSTDAASHESEAVAVADKTAEGCNRGEQDVIAAETQADDVILIDQTSYIDAERLAARDVVVGTDRGAGRSQTEEEKSVKTERLVDVSLANSF
jgi:21S rRNA (uridine2791-2'-O)-methyltransferase